MPPDAPPAKGAVTNEDVARMLDEFADVYGALGDRHRRLAYERAAASVRSAGVRIGPGTTKTELDALPNVGASIADKIRELVTSGRVAKLDAMRRERLPRDFHAFVAIPGIGPALARRIFRDLGVGTLEELEAAARDGRLRHVDGVSQRLESRVATAAREMREQGAKPRVLLVRAWRHAEPLARAIAERADVERVEIAGSIRRRKPLVGDIDLVAATRAPDAVAAAFAELPDVVEVLQRGEHTRVRLQSGMEADLWVVPPEGWGAALSYATGSREHTLELRKDARAAGCRVNNTSVLDASGEALPVESEEAFYRALGMQHVPPELREHRGEIEAAAAGALPRLVARDDVRTDLHVHTTASDGAATLDTMVQAAADLGHEFVCISDHTQGLPVPRGMDEDAFLARIDDIAEREFPIPVLVGAEVNILGDGSLSLDAGVLERLDVVIASLHSGLRDEREKITKRVTDALSTGLVDVLGHPTTRRLPARPESAIDFDRVFDVAAENGVALEINGSPERLDLPGALAKRAKERGLVFAIDSDAHSPRELENVDLGVATARRGWLEAENVVTTRPLDDFLAWVRGRRGGRRPERRAADTRTQTRRR